MIPKDKDKKALLLMVAAFLNNGGDPKAGFVRSFLHRNNVTEKELVDYADAIRGGDNRQPAWYDRF